MSIRPMDLEDFPETSFEDLDTTLNRQPKLKGPHHELSPLGRYHRNPPANSTPSMTTSSDGTTFSNGVGRDSEGSKSEDEEHDDDDDDDFLNDFKEFQNRKDDFDDALRLHFNLYGESPTLYENNVGKNHREYIAEEIEQDRDDDDEEDDTELDEAETVENYYGTNGDFAMNKLANRLHTKLRVSGQLKQPRSMMELKPQTFRNGSVALRNSQSSGNLRQRTNSMVRFKKSMPSLSRFNPTIDEGEDIYPNEYEDDIPGNRGDLMGKRSRRNNFNYFNNFQEDDNETASDQDFQFDKNLVQPQFLSAKSKNVVPIKLLPSQYDIVRDDTLLTPRLHRRNKEWNSKSQLNNFKEGKTKSSKHSAVSRIKIIKQEIDHNTPIKEGHMYYNPKTMRWEGNEKILEKFLMVDSKEKKPLLIRTRSQRPPQLNHIAEPLSYNIDLKSSASQNLANINNSDRYRRPSSKNPRIVGKMMFDDENLRWINMDKNVDLMDPFKNIPDIVIPQKGSLESLRSKESNSPFLRSKSQQIGRATKSNDRHRGSNSTRFHSIGISNSDSKANNNEGTFRLSADLLERFYHEENKWNKKVGSWIILNDKGSIRDLKDNNDIMSGNRNKNGDKYMYEIRTMVMNSSRG